MHNQERQIRATIHELLDLSVMTRAPFRLIVVDDGSTDDTFETASELSRTYPQVRALRQNYRGGFSAALELVRSRLPLDKVIVHDGVTPVDPMELKQLIARHHGDRSNRTAVARPRTATTAVDAGRFVGLRSLQESMEIAHRAVTSFSYLRMEKPVVPRRRVATDIKPVSPVLAHLPTTNYLAQLPTTMGTTPFA